MRIAVLGTGSAGSHHLEALRAFPQVEALVIPRRQSRLAQLAADGFNTADSIADVSMSSSAGAAIIATDTSDHVLDALEAMDHGLDVLVEKPMAVDSVEGRRLNDAAVKLGRKLYVGCVLRFSESMLAFHGLLEQAGPIHSVQVQSRSFLPDWRPNRPYQSSYSSRETEGGVLLDVIHEIDYAGWIFGWPEELQARLRNTGRLGIASEEMAELWWETEAGVQVSVALDYLTKPSRRSMTACGEHGTIEWDGIAGTVTLALGDGEADRQTFDQTGTEMFQSQLGALIDALNGSDNTGLATGDEGVKALAVCDAARRASDRGQREMVLYQ